MRQIVEKSIQFNHPAYLCFVDLKKAFDRVGLADVMECLREREVPEQIVRIIKELNTDTIARIKSNNQTSRTITITNGVRQGDSLSPMLFNLIMDKIITNFPKELGYRMGNNPINIICYADDAVQKTGKLCC
jgi:retron-type reverse transcriptase